MQFVNLRKWFYRRSYKKTRFIKLGFNNLYIFPNVFGLYWITVAIIIYILGINLENDFSVFIFYLMVTVLAVSLFLTHFNIHGLEMISINQRVNFANSKINYQIILKTQKTRNNIKLKFINNKRSIFIEKIENKLIKSLPLNGKKRGIYSPDIIYGESSSPLSLFNCWFYWRPIDNLIIAPEKNKVTKYREFTLNEMTGEYEKSKGYVGDELQEVQFYKKGDKKSLIYWKSLARTGTLLSKKFNNLNLRNNYLILNQNIPIEKALEHLCFEIYNEYINNNFYGIFLSENKIIKSDKGQKHYFKCMEMLARY